MALQAVAVAQNHLKYSSFTYLYQSMYLKVAADAQNNSRISLVDDEE